MSYRLLALDMDGTLLTSDKRVSPGTREFLRSLASNGVSIAYSTGRNAVELGEYLEELPFIRFGSLMSGACVCDLSVGTTIFERPIDGSIVAEVLRRAAVENAMCHMMAARTSLARQADIDRMPELSMGIYQKMFQRVCTRIDDAEAWVLAHPASVDKLNLYHASTEARERTRKRLADLSLQLVDSEQTSLECSALGVSKAEGLRTLCEHLGITMEQVVAVGDAPNDLEALGAVGFPVAMGNATPEVLAVAHRIVADNDHDGITELADLF